MCGGLDCADTCISRSNRNGAAITGAVLGLGFGFRTDVVSYLPFVLLAVLAFRPGFDRTDLDHSRIRRRGCGGRIRHRRVTDPQGVPKRRQHGTRGPCWDSRIHHATGWGLHEAPYSFGYLYHDSIPRAGSRRLFGTARNVERAVLCSAPGYTKWSDEYYRTSDRDVSRQTCLFARGRRCGVFQLPFRQATSSSSVDRFVMGSIFQYRATLLSWLA